MNQEQERQLLETARKEEREACATVLGAMLTALLVANGHTDGVPAGVLAVEIAAYREAMLDGATAIRARGAK